MVPPGERAGWLAGGGAMGDLVRAMDWSHTPLGPIESWPAALRTTVSLALASNFPISIAWGPGRVQIYNDGYWPICGGKHPGSMGQDFKECWASAWPAIGEAFESASAGKTAFVENQRMFLDRHGYLEETFFTFSFSPIRDESGRVVGLFHPVTEMTEAILAERRLGILRDVADATADSATLEDASRLIVETLGVHQLDVPFAMLYHVDPEGPTARLAHAAHVAPGTGAAPRIITLNANDDGAWPIAVDARAAPMLVEDLEARFGPLACGPYPESPQRAMVMPIQLAGLAHPLAVLVAGASPRRAFDATYRTFYLMLQETVTNALVNARSYEEERKRAEALAELDRAKTTFFSNVSHEFRTPLTLLLAPLEDALASGQPLPDGLREQLDVAHRNSLRLLRLVNTLLDFTRIEAGRVQACYEATDLAAFTRELASNFQSACERAGIGLHVDCLPLPEPVWVDRDMWEKIVLNLVSNAFKFTFEGGIHVSLRATPEHAVLEVRDTGTGIPEHELPRLFERFRRVEANRGRTHEGTGIGLALVRELARLHGGTVAVDSEVGRGTTFTISIPRGSAHLPAEQVGAPARPPRSSEAAAFVEEAKRWLPSNAGLDLAMEADSTTSGRPRILLADDNADMRDYLSRLLGERFDVQVAADGEVALGMARASPPDLVLTDVMMPGLDGFELLRALRGSETTRGVPVILLSARAGEEARVEGLDAGADDYLVKPFSARELLARVETRLRMSEIRRQTELQFRAFADATPVMLWVTDARGQCTFLSRGWYEYTGQTESDALGEGWLGAVHPEDRGDVARRLAGRGAHRESFWMDYRLRRADGEYRWVIDSGRPRFDGDGEWLGHVGAVVDMHERVQTEQALWESRDQLRAVADNVPVMIARLDREGYFRFANAEYEHWFGLAPEVLVGRHLRDVIGTETYGAREPWIERVLAGETVRFEGSTPHRTLGRRSTELAYVPDVGPNGEVRGFYAHVVDITERKQAEDRIRRQGQRLELLNEAAEVILGADDAVSMLQQLFARLTEELDVDAYFNFAVEEGAEALRLVSYAGAAEDTAQRWHRMAFGEAVSGVVARDQKTIVETHVQQSTDPRLQAARESGMRAYVCHPLVGDGELLGTLSFGSRSVDAFDDDALALLATISRYVTAAYQRMRLIAQMREADRRKDEFLATLAHELRNPLAPIRTGILVVRESGDPVEIDESLGIMERQTRQLTRLIDDLLDVSRITRGKLELRKSDVMLADVVRSAVEAARPLVDDAGHELRVVLPDAPVVLHADLSRLAQVFSNLLGNAAKYTPDGGRIDLEARLLGQDVEVSVRDNGLGLAAEMRDRVFEMFVQADRSLERRQPGLGIGLTLVKSLVELHGGEVTVRSEGRGRGSEFTVRIPIAVARSEPRAEVRAAPAPASSTRRVLVVDDNEDAAWLLRASFELRGHDVRTAHDGLEAVEVAADFRPHVILMDLGMPRMNGYDAARQIREQPWGAGIKLVALTGWGQDSDKQLTREAGFDHHLVKPAEPSVIESLLGEDADAG